MILNQSSDDEVAVPAIHLIESSAGDDVFFRQIEQTIRLDFSGIDFTELINYLRKTLDLNLALLLKLLHVVGHADVSGQVKHRCGWELRIDHRFALRHRARERVPTNGDVIANWIESGRGGRLLRASTGR